MNLDRTPALPTPSRARCKFVAAAGDEGVLLTQGNPDVRHHTYGMITVLPLMRSIALSLHMSEASANRYFDGAACP